MQKEKVYIGKLNMILVQVTDDNPNTFATKYTEIVLKMNTLI